MAPFLWHDPAVEDVIVPREDWPPLGLAPGKVLPRFRPPPHFCPAWLALPLAGVPSY